MGLCWGGEFRPAAFEWAEAIGTSYNRVTRQEKGEADFDLTCSFLADGNGEKKVAMTPPVKWRRGEAGRLAQRNSAVSRPRPVTFSFS